MTLRPAPEAIFATDIVLNFRTYGTDVVLLYANDQNNNFVELFVGDRSNVVFMFNSGDVLHKSEVVVDGLTNGSWVQVHVQRTRHSGRSFDFAAQDDEELMDDYEGSLNPLIRENFDEEQHWRARRQAAAEEQDVPQSLQGSTVLVVNGIHAQPIFHEFRQMETYSVEPFANNRIQENIWPKRPPVSEIKEYSQLFVGGVDLEMTRDLSGVSGIVKGLLIDRKPFDLEAITSQFPDTKKGIVALCDNSPCENNGSCSNVWGQGFRCDCRETSFAGTACNKDIGITFDGNAYVAFIPPQQLSGLPASRRRRKRAVLYTLESEELYFTFSTGRTPDEGRREALVVVEAGERSFSNTQDMIVDLTREGLCVTLSRRGLEKKSILKGNYADGKRHLFKLKRTAGGGASFYVDDKMETVAGLGRSLQYPNILHVGGVGQGVMAANIWFDTRASDYRNYSGCMSNAKYVVNFERNIPSRDLNIMESYYQYNVDRDEGSSASAIGSIGFETACAPYPVVLPPVVPTDAVQIFRLPDFEVYPAELKPFQLRNDERVFGINKATARIVIIVLAVIFFLLILLFIWYAIRTGKSGKARKAERERRDHEERMRIADIKRQREQKMVEADTAAANAYQLNDIPIKGKGHDEVDENTPLNFKEQEPEEDVEWDREGDAFAHSRESRDLSEVGLERDYPALKASVTSPVPPPPTAPRPPAPGAPVGTQYLPPIRERTSYHDDEGEQAFIKPIPVRTEPVGVAQILKQGEKAPRANVSEANEPIADSRPASQVYTQHRSSSPSGLQEGYKHGTPTEL